MSDATFGTQLMGKTEKALSAILVRQLVGTGLSESQWVTLVVTAGSGTVERDGLTERVAGTFKISNADAAARIDDLIAANLVGRVDEGSQVELTDAGKELLGRVRTGVAAITERLWGDLSPADLATAGHVLGTVLARANGELAGV